MRVREIMSSPVVSVPPDRSLKSVARLLDRNRVSAVPVVEDRRVVGVVSKTDLITLEQAFELDDGGRVGRRLRRRRNARRVETVRDAMTAPALTVAPSLSVVGAAWLMTEHNAHHLPVVDRGELVGMVSRSDLVRAFARSDEQIRAEIADEILPSFGLSANDVDVAVADGEVALSGVVDDDVTARCLPHALRGVIGVVEVDSHLRATRHAPLVDVVSPTL